MDIREEFEFTLPLGYKEKMVLFMGRSYASCSSKDNRTAATQRVQRNRAYDRRSSEGDHSTQTSKM